MGNDRNIVSKIIDLYFKGEYPAAVEQRVKQWLADGVLSEEKDRAMREQWDRLQVEPEKSVRTSYEQVKRTLGFNEAGLDKSGFDKVWPARSTTADPSDNVAPVRSDIFASAGPSGALRSDSAASAGYGAPARERSNGAGFDGTGPSRSGAAEYGRPVRSAPLRRDIGSRFHFRLRVAAIILLLLVVGGALFVYKTDTGEALVARLIPWNEVNVPNGQRQQLTLPDGTDVLLNAGSAFSYPKFFWGRERHVRFAGEGRFIVTKDISRPFVVETGNMSVKVVGTRFDIMAYNDSDKETVRVLSGKVAVAAGDQSHTLTPGRQLSLMCQSGAVELKAFDLNHADDWLSGTMVFDNDTMDDILGAIERNMNVNFVKENGVSLSHDFYTVEFDNGNSINQIMDVLTSMSDEWSKYTIKGDSVMLSKE